MVRQVQSGHSPALRIFGLIVAVQRREAGWDGRYSDHSGASSWLVTLRLVYGAGWRGCAPCSVPAARAQRPAPALQH